MSTQRGLPGTVRRARRCCVPMRAGRDGRAWRGPGRSRLLRRRRIFQTVRKRALTRTIPATDGVSMRYAAHKPDETRPAPRIRSDTSCLWWEMLLCVLLACLYHAARAQMSALDRRPTQQPPVCLSRDTVWCGGRGRTFAGLPSLAPMTFHRFASYSLIALRRATLCNAHVLVGGGSGACLHVWLGARTSSSANSA